MRWNGMDEKEWYGIKVMVWMRRDGMDEMEWYG